MFSFSKIALRCSIWICLTLMLGAGAAQAQGLQLHPRPNVVGNANQFGYARIVKNLGSLPISNERDLPLILTFSSDPDVIPGALGPGWRFPLLDSTVYRSRRGVLVWESPDEYRRFFVINSAADVPRGQTGYLSQKSDWSAIEDERRGIIILRSRQDPEQFFEYRDGRLHQFCMGEGLATLSLEYSGHGGLHQMVECSSRDALLRFEYSGSKLEKFHVGEQPVEVEMGRGDWITPDGKSRYRTAQISFLCKLTQGESVESFTYTRGEGTDRKVGKETHKLPVNRLSLERSGNESWLSFEAQSGFLVADSGASYAVLNGAYDPIVKGASSGAGQPRISPKLVEIRRKLNSGGAEQLWSRDWPKGLETYTEPGGSLTRKTWIMSKGPAYGKLRRIEEKSGDAWEMVKTMTYRPDGKLLREIDQSGDVVNYLYDNRGALLSVIGNGKELYSLTDVEGRGRVIFEQIKPSLYRKKYSIGQMEVSELRNTDNNTTTIVLRKDGIKKLIFSRGD